MNITPGGGPTTYNASINDRQVFNSANGAQFNGAVNVERGLNQMRMMEGMKSDYFASHDRIMRERINYEHSFNSYKNQGTQWGIEDGIDLVEHFMPNNRFVQSVGKFSDFYSVLEIRNDILNGNHDKAFFGTLELAGGVYTVYAKALSFAIQTDYSHQKGVGGQFHKNYMNCLHMYKITGDDKYIDKAQHYYELMYRTKENLNRKK